MHHGDVGAFNKIYWEYHAAIYANAFKLTHEEATSEDIVQEVFTTLWEKRKTIDPQQPIEGWLFVVSYNKSIDQLKRKLKLLTQQKKLESITETITDDRINLKEVQLNALEEAMTHLSPQKRKVFELCKLQGKTYEKAAAELQISKHTVKEYLSEAIISVKKYVQQHPEHHFLLIGMMAFADWVR